MFYRLHTGVLLAVVLSLLLVQPLQAGGWTVVTLADLPRQVQAGEPVMVSFLVQQHGRTPLEFPAGEVIIYARQQSNGQIVQVAAKATGDPGYYHAELLFPASGVWRWEVRPGGFPPAVMPDLTVVRALRQPSHPPQAAAREWGWWQQVLWQVFSSVRPPAAPVATVAVDLAQDPVAYGKALFVAKGCVTCHVHGAVTSQFSLEVGPNLTTYQVIPEYVAVWLRDPQSIKPATQMPQLPLQAAEIEALIAFLSN